MDPARGTPRAGTARARTTVLRLSSTLVGACAAVVVLAVPAFADPSSTTVNPAGDGFTASLTPGTSADFTAGNVTVSCNRSSTSGQVPVAPNNHNDAGPVDIALSAPTFTNSPSPCTTNVFFVSATTVTSGDWSIAIQFAPDGPDPDTDPDSTGTLTVPQGGVVVTTSGLANCTVTVAPTAADTVTGALHPGDPTANPPVPPTLVFTDEPVDISVTGTFGCPTAQRTGTFTATYDINDITHSDQQFTVTP